MTFFWDPPGKKLGLKAEIKRHREYESKLDQNIAECEQRTDMFGAAGVRIYRNLRAKLLQSKAEVVSKIGKKS